MATSTSDTKEPNAGGIASSEFAPSDALGYQVFGRACVGGYCWPGGAWGHLILGDGLYIDHEEASATDLIGAGTGGAQFCNWRVDFIRLDANNNVLSTNVGPITSGCTIGEVGRVSDTNVTLSVATLQSCAVLYNAGSEVVRQCHFIYP